VCSLWQLIVLASFVTIYCPPGQGWTILANWLLAVIAALVGVTLLARSRDRAS